eukprot:TRINITY_DN330_c2_g1_i1.p1 TRINITY_DN330_c2_g1~~TRINITY_DN330_c2_g1_i1.p1  ORF type:complete len:1351 (+),score=248.97 TRINITY_DN330_c2_g1_i1:68-4120(+)
MATLPGQASAESLESPAAGLSDDETKPTDDAEPTSEESKGAGEARRSTRRLTRLRRESGDGAPNAFTTSQGQRGPGWSSTPAAAPERAKRVRRSSFTLNVVPDFAQLGTPESRRSCQRRSSDQRTDENDTGARLSVLPAQRVTSIGSVTIAEESPRRTSRRADELVTSMGDLKPALKTRQRTASFSLQNASTLSAQLADGAAAANGAFAARENFGTSRSNLCLDLDAAKSGSAGASFLQKARKSLAGLEGTLGYLRSGSKSQLRDDSVSNKNSHTSDGSLFRFGSKTSTGTKGSSKSKSTTSSSDSDSSSSSSGSSSSSESSSSGSGSSSSSSQPEGMGRQLSASSSAGGTVSSWSRQYCAHCNNKFMDDSKFCRKCGKPREGWRANAKAKRDLRQKRGHGTDQNPEVGESTGAGSAMTRGDSSYIEADVPWIYSTRADLVFGVVTFLNVVYIGVETDLISQMPSEMPCIMDTSFLLLYLFELQQRWSKYDKMPQDEAEEVRRPFFFAFWNAADFFLVCVGIVEGWIIPLILALNNMYVHGGMANSGWVVNLTSAMQSLRLLRLLRMMRFFRILRELLLLAQGIVGALKALTWATLLVFLTLYGCSIMTTLFIGRSDHIESKSEEERAIIAEWFGTVPASLFTLFQLMTLEGWNEVVRTTWKIAGVWTSCCFVVFVMFTNLVLLNLVAGVILENVLAISRREEEKAVQKEEATKIHTIRMIHNLFDSVLGRGSAEGELTLYEFKKACNYPRVIKQLHSLAIAPHEAEELFYLMDNTKKGSINLDHFIEGCLRIRGAARAKHLLCVQFDVQKVWSKLSEQLDEMEDMLMTQFEDIQVDLIVDEMEHHFQGFTDEVEDLLDSFKADAVSTIKEVVKKEVSEAFKDSLKTSVSEALKEAHVEQGTRVASGGQPGIAGQEQSASARPRAEPAPELAGSEMERMVSPIASTPISSYVASENVEDSSPMRREAPRQPWDCQSPQSSFCKSSDASPPRRNWQESESHSDGSESKTPMHSQAKKGKPSGRRQLTKALTTEGRGMERGEMSPASPVSPGHYRASTGGLVTRGVSEDGAESAENHTWLMNALSEVNSRIQAFARKEMLLSQRRQNEFDNLLKLLNGKDAGVGRLDSGSRHWYENVRSPRHGSMEGGLDLLLSEEDPPGQGRNARSVRRPAAEGTADTTPDQMEAGGILERLARTFRHTPSMKVGAGGSKRSSADTPRDTQRSRSMMEDGVSRRQSAPQSGSRPGFAGSSGPSTLDFNQAAAAASASRGKRNSVISAALALFGGTSRLAQPSEAQVASPSHAEQEDSSGLSDDSDEPVEAQPAMSRAVSQPAVSRVTSSRRGSFIKTSRAW